VFTFLGLLEFPQNLFSFGHYIFTKKISLLKNSSLTVLLLLACTVTFSQENVPSLLPDSISNGHHTDTIKRKKFAWHRTVISATLVAYGVAALEFDWFKDWNEAVKKEIWTDAPHKQIHFDNYLQWSPAVGTLALGIAGVKGEHNFTDRLFIFGIAELIQSSVVACVKKISNETRPNGGGNESFPSGHTANAFTGAEFMRLEYRNRSPWYGVLGYTLAAGTGFLRMYNNKHWLSDVAASAGTGILSTDLAYYVYPKIKRLLFPKKNLHTIILPTYQCGVAGIAVVHRF
jgi:membrane-associated phospholipid phosphatase